MPEVIALAASYDHCRSLARRAARNFYYGFRLLPPAKRDALCALYAFMRRADDIADDAGALESKPASLAAWRAQLDRALAGDAAAHPVWPALADCVSRYAIPPRYLHDLISGTEMDLTETEYPTFEKLREYCYRVAGAVGLCCVHVFGFTDGKAPPLAERLGIAFQLTNILRDVPRDLAMGRVYLPQDELARFGITPEALAARSASPMLRECFRFQLERARRHFREGRHLIPLIHQDSRAALWALARIYTGILDKIEARNYDVLSPPPAGLSAAEKMWTLARARFGFWPKDEFNQNRAGDGRRPGGPFLRRRPG
ncbi:MAG: presqualene diphosphate synthase HpnD [Candidatus Acidiferrales bacterium]